MIRMKITLRIASLLIFSATLASTNFTAFLGKVIYKRLINLKIATAQGVIYDEIPEEVAKEQSITTSDDLTSESAVKGWWENQKKMGKIENLEMERINKGLALIQLLMNSNYAFKRIARETIVLIAKAKSLYIKFSTFDAPKKYKKQMETPFEFGKNQYNRHKAFNSK